MCLVYLSNNPRYVSSSTTSLPSFASGLRLADRPSRRRAPVGTKSSSRAASGRGDGCYRHTRLWAGRAALPPPL
jgi:hypothetical protein